MKPIDLQTALSKIEEERRKLDELAKAYALVAQHQAQLDGDTATAPAISESQPVAKPEPQRPELVLQEESKPQKTKIVQRAVDSINGEFTIDDVEQALGSSSGLTRLDISFVLSRMKKAGKVESVEKGAGKKSSVFRKITFPLSA